MRREDTLMELGCVVIRPVLKYVRERKGDAVLQSIAEKLGLRLDYLDDWRNWISFECYSRLLDEVVKELDEADAPYTAAKLYTDFDAYGSVGRLVCYLGSPGASYRMMALVSARWDRVNVWRVVESQHNRCVLAITSRCRQTKNNCLCIQGGLAAIPRLWKLPYAQVTELQCACEGGDACVYEIVWQGDPRRLWGSVGFTLALGVGACVGGVMGWNVMTYAFTLVVSFMGYFWGREIDYSRKLTDVYRRHDETAASLEEAIRGTEKLNEELQHRVEERTDELFQSTRELERALAELKASRERELVAEKQAAVGVLAGGTAHEINNPLNAVSLCIQSLKEDLTDAGMISQLELAERATRRCKRIVNDLLSLSREPQRQGAVSLERILGAALTLFEKEDSGSVEVRTTVAPDLPRLMVDRMQIQQAILNLVKNASDAMDGKGTIEAALEADGENVVLSIADEGPGIKEEDRQKIFDPFFTTKRVGKGMGLGLSITYQLVRRNGGSIEVDSSEHGGATFRMVFPIVPRDLGDQAEQGAIIRDAEQASDKEAAPK